MIKQKEYKKIRTDIANVHRDMDLGIIKSTLYGLLNKQTYPQYLKHHLTLERQRELFKKAGTLIMRITNNLYQGSDLTHRHYGVIIEFDGYKNFLMNHKSINDPHGSQIKDLIILLQYNNGSYEIKIPDKDKSNLLRYLLDKPTDDIFDCYSFICFIKGLSVIGDKQLLLNTEWRIAKQSHLEGTPFGINGFAPGTCVALCDYATMKHFAYYLGDGLYLSQFGRNDKTVGGAPLVVCTLADMHDIYGTNNIRYMTPKKPPM